MSQTFVHQVDYTTNDQDIVDPLVITFGDFRLDVSRRLLWCDGTAKSVPDKLMAMLLVFLRSGGTVINKADLAQAVWPDQPVTQANFNQHIFMLRQLLGEAPHDRVFIVTHRRKGLHFVTPGDIREEPIRKAADDDRSYLSVANQCL